jgi:hypothetical protein
MANVNIKSDECAWSKFEVKMLGRVIRGLRGFELKKTVEKEYVYGAGDDPLDINTGNKKYEGNVKVLGFESDALDKAAQNAGYDDITEVPHEFIVITISYKKRKTDPITTRTAVGVAFTETGISLEQNAKNRETTLPFIAMNIS